MPGQRGTEQRRMSAQVLVRLLPEERGRLEALAIRDGLTLADYVRRRVVGDIITRPVEIAARTDREALSELRRLGGLAKVALLKGGGLREEARQTLSDIAAAVARLAAPPS